MMIIVQNMWDEQASRRTCQNADAAPTTAAAFSAVCTRCVQDSACTKENVQALSAISRVSASTDDESLPGAACGSTSAMAKMEHLMQYRVRLENMHMPQQLTRYVWHGQLTRLLA